MSDASVYVCGYNTDFVQSVWKRRREEECARIKHEVRRKRAAIERRKQAEERRIRREAEAIKRASKRESEKRLEELRKAGINSVRDVILKWAEIYGFSPDIIRGPGRSRELVECRMKAIAEAYVKFPHMSQPQLGRIFNRDHTTILHAVRKMGVHDPNRWAGSN